MVRWLGPFKGDIGAQKRIPRQDLICASYKSFQNHACMIDLTSKSMKMCASYPGNQKQIQKRKTIMHQYLQEWKLIHINQACRKSYSHVVQVTKICKRLRRKHLSRTRKSAKKIIFEICSSSLVFYSPSVPIITEHFKKISSVLWYKSMTYKIWLQVP